MDAQAFAEPEMGDMGVFSLPSPMGYSYPAPFTRFSTFTNYNRFPVCDNRETVLHPIRRQLRLLGFLDRKLCHLDCRALLNAGNGSINDCRIT